MVAVFSITTWVNSLQNSTCYLSKNDNKNVDKIIDNQILA